MYKIICLFSFCFLLYSCSSKEAAHEEVDIEEEGYFVYSGLDISKPL